MNLIHDVYQAFLLFVWIHLFPVCCRVVNAQRVWLQVRMDGMRVKISVVLKLMLVTDQQCLTFPISAEVCYPLTPGS